ncbi:MULTISPECIES: acyl-CoA dehydrogenase family protein [Amycolatopsis]|uniref:Acyl-CoA dehydrogenase family protein n=1 Tax=Amycolatopsis thermalba TaxID=944492 RepID=A0ABY4NZJ5_9PSEU|nr:MULTISPECIES: acyl-CoA dehydrogenase family protein [Amycolatopsis]OXM66390.1 acyl-CoA dehydrogenase [Amycolatopsis sp. KNN50.9b]UQS25408.1 acyl-CoA dehydrogenase family protein [Amycolatopsis thermalba]
MSGWSETELLIRDSVRAWVDKEVRPHTAELETGAVPPYAIIRKFWADFGVGAMASDALGKFLGERKSSGGGGGAFAGQAGLPLIVASELAGVSLGMLVSIGVSLGLTAQTILAKGTPEQKRRWLPRLVTFEDVGAWAITEPGSGSDAFGGMQTTARRDGDGYVLNGQKTFITNGPFADVLVVFAKLDTGEGIPVRDRPVLTFVLEKDDPGLTRGKPFRKMGIMSSPTGELFFDDVRLGRDRLLGGAEPVAGADAKTEVKTGFTLERVGVGALALGIINECHRLSVEYAKTRMAWGQEIGRYQLVQLKLAKMEIARINVENMVLSAVAGLREGRTPSLAEASAIKLYASEAATDVAMEAVQLFGGNGYMAEYRVEQLARDAKSLMIYAGSNEIQVTHIAKGLLARG